jgi:hypothetical protein
MAYAIAPRRQLRSVPLRGPRTQIISCAALLIGMAGCSLVSLKSPERPLSTRDLNARILTRELSSQFAVAIARCAGDIAATEDDEAVLTNTLRWEIAAVAQSRRAATQMSPMLSLLDTWALAAQMRAFMAEGAPGGALFGMHQAAVREVSDNFSDGAETLARGLTVPGEFSEYQSFVERYAREHPLQDLTFARVSVIVSWTREKGLDTTLVDSLGTVPQALADASQRLQIYGDTVPPQVMRETRLALREAGYSQGDLHSSLKQLDERLARLGAVAKSAPDFVRTAVADVRQSLREILDRLDASSRSTTDALAAQRAALYADLRSEREAMVAAVDTQRKALALDAARIADQVVRNSGEQARRLAAEATLLLIGLTVIVLGMPFAAGYILGRARHGRATPPV